MEAILMKANGSTKNVIPNNNSTSFSLKELQGFVGGYIELLELPKKYMVVNEEGKIDGLEVNIEATELYRKHHPENTDYIVGDVLICDYNLIN